MRKLLLSLTILILTSLAMSKETGLLRFPAIYEDQIVFSYAGDLYTVSADGGVARRLTSHIGFESFPRFSHDGKYIAFTGQYDGNTEVYLIPAEGGVPKRATFTATLKRDDISDRMGPNNIVMGWKHDNKTIVFRSRMSEFNDFKGQLYTVGIDGDIQEQLPLPRGGFCSFSQNDKQLAYNRVFREFRTWKRYRGGMADDIWIYDFENKTTENITDNPAQDIIPMWWGNKIYFLSDRDDNKRMNLYVYDIASKQTKRLTKFKDFDIKFPSLGRTKIVFENGGFIYKFDIGSEKYEKVSVEIANDQQASRGEIISVSDRISNYEISPDGKRALFGARGDVFTVPAEHGKTRNITASSDVHERNSKWSPDGKWIAYISDKTGENEIFILPQYGEGKEIQLTSNADTYKYQIYWSPDSKKLLWADKKLRLSYYDLAAKKLIRITQAEMWEFRHYSWSPDSKWIAYAKYEKDSMNKIYLYSLETEQQIQVTDGWYSCSYPSFSSDGKYLFFTSDRNFNPLYSQTEWNHAYRDMGGIYFVTLSKKTDSPFKPESDEVAIEKEKSEEKNNKSKDEKKEDESVKVIVDADGITDRILSLPIKASSYSSPMCVGDNVYYTRKGSQDAKPLLLFYDLKKKKETEVGQFNGFEISADNKKMLVSQNKSYAIIDLPKGKVELKDKLDLKGLQVKVDRKQEWVQIFNETWRQMRDFLYDPNMHGLDWEGIRNKYRPLVDYVNHRADLTYVIGEMIGELSIGHSYVGGGDQPAAKRIETGLLGAILERDKATRFYKIKKILKGENWKSSRRSPLTEIGIDAKEGDFILAVNGKSTKGMLNIYAELVNTVGTQVTLTINSLPQTEGSRDIVVIPTGDELDLYYYNWVQDNIHKVDVATKGQVGYIHVPDMDRNGLNEFVKHFYPQLRKKALIIDVRGNGGGNVSPMIIERLQREAVMLDMARNTAPGTDPGALIYGPKVCLMDEFSASDGDIFPYRFKQLGLGKLIGKRSWGGVVGIRGSLPLVDGGYLYKPEFAPYSLDGSEWVIEGVGVEPDIVVDNDPAKEYEGIDQQLNKAIEVVLEELKTQGKKIYPIPPFPKK